CRHKAPSISGVRQRPRLTNHLSTDQGARVSNPAGRATRWSHLALLAGRGVTFATDAAVLHGKPVERTLAGGGCAARCGLPDTGIPRGVVALAVASNADWRPLAGHPHPH